MALFLENYILVLFSNCFMKCEVSETNYIYKKNNLNLRISRCYDNTHETVVTPATGFDILRKCSIFFFGCGDLFAK